jgi:hypothetical protein
MAGEISWDFDGGKLAAARELAPDHWECAIFGDTDAAGRNRSAIWFGCELRGMSGRPITLDLVDLTNEWNLRPSMPWGPHTRPVLAVGPATVPPGERPWRRLAEQEVTWLPAEGPCLRLQFIVPVGDVATLAYIESYPYGDHRRFVDSVVAADHAALQHRALGQSPEGRPIDLLTIGDGAGCPAVWAIFRQHPWETYSSFAAEGFVERLLASADLAGGRRWYVVPMLNPDGCYHGYTRHNPAGHDPNREWLSRQPTPEVAVVRDAVLATTPDAPAVFVDVHNNNQETVEYLALSSHSYGERPAEAQVELERQEASLRRLAGALAQGSHFSGEVRLARRPAAFGPAGAAPETPAGSAGKPFHFPSVLLEMRTGPLATPAGGYGTIGDQRRLGAALAESLAAFLP